MNYTDYLNLFDQDKAIVAILSTFGFDPAFFEARILRSKALEQARRVIVFMDATEYCRLQREGTRARYINRRYLLVPVRPDTRCNARYPHQVALQAFIRCVSLTQKA